MRFAGRVTYLIQMRKAYRVSVGKPERRILLGRPRGRWEGYIKMVLNSVASSGTQFIADMMRDQRQLL